MAPRVVVPVRLDPEAVDCIKQHCLAGYKDMSEFIRDAVASHILLKMKVMEDVNTAPAPISAADRVKYGELRQSVKRVMSDGQDRKSVV